MRNPTSWILGGMIALLLALSSVFVVNESQTAIVLNLGKIVRSDLKPGLHFKWPLVEDVRKFDRRLLSLADAAERYQTAEKTDVEVDYFVKWKIVDPVTFYRAAGGGSEEAARTRLRPIVKNALRNEINQRVLLPVPTAKPSVDGVNPAVEATKVSADAANQKALVSSGRSDLTGRLLKTINAGAANLGIEVLDVRIKRIALPQDSNILDSVFERMRSDRQKVANRLRAEGVQASEGIKSDADRQRQVILAEAHRESQTMRGEGDGRAAEIGAAAYGQDAEFYSFYRSLEAYRASLADGKTVMVLDPDSEFLQYFEKDGR